MITVTLTIILHVDGNLFKCHWELEKLILHYTGSISRHLAMLHNLLNIDVFHFIHFIYKTDCERQW